MQAPARARRPEGGGVRRWSWRAAAVFVALCSAVNVLGNLVGGLLFSLGVLGLLGAWSMWERSS